MAVIKWLSMTEVDATAHGAAPADDKDNVVVADFADVVDDVAINCFASAYLLVCLVDVNDGDDEGDNDDNGNDDNDLDDDDDDDNNGVVPLLDVVVDVSVADADADVDVDVAVPVARRICKDLVFSINRFVAIVVVAVTLAGALLAIDAKDDKDNNVGVDDGNVA